MAEKKLIGSIAHFYAKISVAVVDLTDSLKVGDKISIERPSGAIEQIVQSMQIDLKDIQEAKAGQSIGLKVDGVTRDGAKVFKIIE